jgi:hypothetical protein
VGPGSYPVRVTPFILERGYILCYRIFDIADEIQLEVARGVLAADTRRMRLNRAGSEYLQLPDPPLSIDLGVRTLQLAQGVHEVEVMARMFSHGAASIILKVPIASGTTPIDLVPLADQLFDSPAVDALSLELMNGLRRDLSAALDRQQLWNQTESYTIIFVEKMQGDPTAAQVLAHVDLPRLLLGETEAVNLSAQERAEVTQTAFSYADRDLAVIDWNGAFVYEPSGSMDIPDVLEICNAQLLEFRYYDELLDVSLRSVYDGLERPESSWKSILSSPYRRMARRVVVTLLEISEFIERVENSLKIIGDFYLARVYEGAVKRLRVRQWQKNVTRKQQLLSNTYGLLKGEVDIARSHVLEATIVLLIVLDIVLYLAPSL